MIEDGSKKNYNEKFRRECSESATMDVIILRRTNMFRYGGLKRFYSGVRLYIAPTNKCNLNCVHCNWKLFGLGMPKEVKEKTLNEWQTLFLNFPIKYREVIIVGGEPALYKDISELVEWLILQNKFVTIYTNLITDRFSVLEKNIRLKIIATYHGNTEEGFFWHYWSRLNCRKEYYKIGETKPLHELADIDRPYCGIAVGPDHLMFTNYRQYIEHYNKKIQR